MSIDTYFQDHWVDVSPERHQVYEQILAWGPMWEQLYEPAGVGEGHVVLDFGCGPGHMTAEMAGRVGPDGHVHGVDINDDFLARTIDRVTEAGLADRVSTHLLDDHHLPFDDGSVDRVLAKNVLEYVPSVEDVVTECFRVTAPDGRMTATDTDWGFIVLHPWTIDEQRRFFDAGAHAFREPFIGRKLRGALLDAGFVDVEVWVQPIVDTSGGLLGVIQNFVGYITEFDTMPGPEVQQMLGRLEDAVADDRYLGIFPQFSVTGRKPG